ncbi:MAG: 6,7-dimethyl-8-ribityllumazine synthase [Bacteroidia bacterium]|nr:6,7-dimethyl-8-ribityllumazine synthase [Bacteroidia bacterium]
MSVNKPHDLSQIRYEGGKDHLASKVAIVVSKWNTEITETLFQGAKDVLIAAGVNPNFIQRVDVPGSYELPMGADHALKNQPELDGVICLGCVIQGETRHFEFISDAVAQGIMRVGLDYHKPVIFGVLTPDTDQQAKDRAGGKYGNKGEEAAVALLEMLDLG